MINLLKGAAWEVLPPSISRTVGTMKAFRGYPVLCTQLHLCAGPLSRGLVNSLRYKVTMAKHRCLLSREAHVLLNHLRQIRLS